MAKGDLNDECNRTACRNRPATFLNQSTRKHYCQPCAFRINDGVGPTELDRLGLDSKGLCIRVSHAEESDE